MLLKKRSKNGFALVYALFMVVIFSILISLLNRSLVESIKDSTKEFRKSGQANSVAKAGIEQAFFWFVRQTSKVVQNENQSQLYNGIDKPFFDPDTKTFETGVVAQTKFFKYPDSAFFPNYDLDNNKRDTDDEKIGLVKDIEVDKSISLYGTYMVKRQLSNNDVNSGGSNTNNIAEAVHDVSKIRSSSLSDKGKIWRINSIGYLYMRNNKETLSDGSFACTYDNNRRSVTADGIVTYTPDTSCNNTYIDTAKASVDIQRITISQQVAAAVMIKKPANITVNSQTQIIGGSRPGVLYTTSTNVTQPGVSQYVKGVGDTISGNITTGFKKAQGLDTSAYNLLSVTEEELRGMSDQVESSVNKLKRGGRKTLGSYQIIYIDPPAPTYNDTTYEAVFDKDNPLRGSGLVYVNGDVKITNDSNSLFSGILYVKGSLYMEIDNQISGTVILEGEGSTLKLPGGTGSTVIEHSTQVINNITEKMSRYRRNSVTFKIYDSNK